MHFLNIDKKLFFRLTARGLILGLGMLLLIHFGLPGQKRNRPGSEKSFAASSSLLFTSMSTSASARLYTDEKRYDFEPAFETIRTEFRNVESLCNFFDPGSELSRLNRTAAEKPFVCSDDLWFLLTQARDYTKKTGGAFDVSISPLMEVWGFYRKEGRLPPESALVSALERTGMDKVRFDEKEKSVFFTVPGMALNLGGIAKGYALDRALAALRKKHPEIKAGFLDLGGNVLSFGAAFQAAVRDPFSPGKICAQIPMDGTRAVATSGAYERFVTIGGRRYGHILDPRTGRPVERCFSATVVAPTGLESDVLSTAFFVAGENLAESFPGIEVLLLRPGKADPGRLDYFQQGAEWTLDLPLRVPDTKVLKIDADPREK